MLWGASLDNRKPLPVAPDNTSDLIKDYLNLIRETFARGEDAICQGRAMIASLEYWLQQESVIDSER